MTVKVTKPALNVAEKLAELNKPTGPAGEAMLRAETPQEQFNLIGAGRRNVLINGDFRVSQRGDYSSATTITSGYYWLDRWIADFGTVATTYQQTDVDLEQLPAKTKGAKITATSSATGYMGIRQKIENPTDYIGSTFTYSAWVKSNSSKARLYTYIQGSTAQLAISDTHSGSGNWEKLSLTFTMTGNPTTAWFVDAFIANNNIGNTEIITGDYIEITAAQLELGKVATPFEYRSYGEELALCQRYYYRVSTDATNGSMAVGFVTSATGARGTITFPVTMRVPPTGIEHTGAATNYKVAYAAVSATCSSVPTFANASNTMCGVNFTVASGLTAGHGIVIERNSGTAYIGFTGAEL